MLFSSNMSVPFNDAAIEALVRSCLDAIILSIDGATQETYQEYRRGGDLALVFDNVRRWSRPSAARSPHAASLLAVPRLSVESSRDRVGEDAVRGTRRRRIRRRTRVMTPYAKHALTPRRTNERRRTQSPDVSAAWQRLADAREARHQYFGCDICTRASASIRTGSRIPAAMLSRPNMPSAMPVRTARCAERPIMRSNRRLMASFTTRPTTHTGSIRACLATYEQHIGTSTRRARLFICTSTCCVHTDQVYSAVAASTSPALRQTSAQGAT